MGMVSETTTVEAPDGTEVELSAFDHCVYLTVYEQPNRKDQYLLKGKTLDNNPSLLSGASVESDFVNREERAEAVDEEAKDFLIGVFMDVGRHFAKAGVVPSNRSGQLMNLQEWGRPTGSYVATVTAEEAGSCPDCGASLSETKVCYSSSRRTRVPNKYKCDPEKGGCGRRFRGITTG